MTEIDILNYLLKHFDIIYCISYLCPTYLIGVALRNFSLGSAPKDFDFVCLDNDHIIEAVIEKFNL